MKKIINWIFYPPVTGQSSILIIRLVVGTAFCFQGFLKLVYINQEMGLLFKQDSPAPQITPDFIASIEIVGGAFLVLGLLTRATTLYFIVQMTILILTTKIHPHSGFSALPSTADPLVTYGPLLLHQLRGNYGQLLCCVFLMLEGPGRRSLDFKFFTTGKIYTMTGK